MRGEEGASRADVGLAGWLGNDGAEQLAAAGGCGGKENPGFAVIKRRRNRAFVLTAHRSFFVVLTSRVG